MADYQKHVRGPQGLNYYCRMCQRAWRMEHREALLESKRTSRIRRREKIQAYTKVYLERNREVLRLRKQQDYIKHREERLVQGAQRRARLRASRPPAPPPWSFVEGRPDLKRCTECRRELPLNAFAKDKNTPSGLMAGCRQCRRIYGERHKAEIQARGREYYIKNREKCLKSGREWKSANPEARTAGDMRRRVRLQGTSDGKYWITTATVRQLWVDSHGLCALCGCALNPCRGPSGKSTRYHVDHILPVCHGGSNDIENLRLTCPTCNLRRPRKPAPALLGSGT